MRDERNTSMLTESNLLALPRGSHVSWVVMDDSLYLPIAMSLAAQGRAANEKVLAFAPAGSPVLETLGPHVAIATDPLVAFLGGRFEVDTWIEHFHEQDAIAKSEGYAGLCIVADMDWTLAASPTLDDVMRFELLLDRLGPELGATIVCAYRASSFSERVLTGVHAVHSLVCSGEEPQFRMIDGPDAWTLLGEIDIAVHEQFMITLRTICGDHRQLLDVSGLRFIDVAGMRALAKSMGKAPLELRGVRPFLRQVWELGGFDQISELRELQVPRVEPLISSN